MRKREHQLMGKSLRETVSFQQAAKTLAKKKDM
jgi:hypothetical protein